eukprot:g19615.t1
MWRNKTEKETDQLAEGNKGKKSKRMSMIDMISTATRGVSKHLQVSEHSRRIVTLRYGKRKLEDLLRNEQKKRNSPSQLLRRATSSSSLHDKENNSSPKPKRLLRSPSVHEIPEKANFWRTNISSGNFSRACSSTQLDLSNILQSLGKKESSSLSSYPPKEANFSRASSSSRLDLPNRLDSTTELEKENCTSTSQPRRDTSAEWKSKLSRMDDLSKEKATEASTAAQAVNITMRKLEQECFLAWERGEQQENANSNPCPCPPRRW